MNIYYICQFDNSYKDEFFDNINSFNSFKDIDSFIDENFYIYNRDNNKKYNNWFLLEAYLFIQYIWKNKWVEPGKIKWLFWENMVILNDDLFVFYNWIYESTYWKNTYFFTSRGAFDDIFWSFWDKISQKDKKFAKLISTNKSLWYTRIEKLTHIMNMYEKRDKLLWDFMLPLINKKSIYDIEMLLKLWNDVTGTSEAVIKWSYGVDNWNFIKLVNIDEYLWKDDKIEYLCLKFFNYLKTYSNLYFVNYYDSIEEKRLYFTKKNNKYELYSVKQKVNITGKDELYDKVSFSTWKDIKIKWVLWENNIWKRLLKKAIYVLKQNNIDAWAIEFIKDSNWNWRFLEINCLWWTLMFDWEDKENIKKRILDIWDNIYLEQK